MAETITVTQLNTRVKSILSDSEAVNDIWVLGEISNLKKYTSGHYYFTLKDNGSEIRGVMFKSSRTRIDFEPQDNMKISAFGRVDLYVERGSYQFVVETMQKAGVGDLYLAYEALKKKLEAEGLFEQSKKKKLPLYPKTIGVVTSPTGAVIHDIITTSGRLFPADILLVPAQVQGDGAAESIAKGIRLLNKEGVDVIIVGRGGGSIEDLWAFNEEIVARAIAASEVPIISAVGHETDFTIADMVADVRAPTPTGAAELALRDRKEVLRHLETDMLRMNRALRNSTEKMQSRFKILDMKLSPKRAEEKVSMYNIRVDELSSRMSAALKDRVDMMQRRFIKLDSNLDLYMKGYVNTADNKLTRYSERLESVNPNKVLERGYSMVTDPNGKVLTSVSKLNNGSKVNIRMRDGSAEAEIKGTERK
jgi:exodeoxyribonuclease VII, large subunit